MAHDEIAIVGVGCRFPGADDLEGFWRVLSKGENHVREIPRDRWNLDDVYDKDPNASRKTNVRQAGFLKDYNEWDPKFFGINEMEAREVDPQQRMVLDCVHMALEDGGIRRQDIDGSYTGVYIGSMNDDFKTEAMASLESVSAYTVTGLHSSIISARVAYVYNLHGPAVTMDTACSSSLVAINCAEQALKLGECNAAICGGANSILDAVQFVALSKARMLSPTGQSKPFSADADGYARGEGCGIVILKRLKDAQRDGNKIWATLTTGCNQDGNTATPITAPSGSMQLDLLQRLYDRSKTDKHSVQVIEAHGTGTPIGDPTEANALGKFFGKQKDSTQKTLIGSVKSNIGHTEAAAGVAGLIKVLLMMKHGQVVPSLLLDKANINPKIDFGKYGFDVPTLVTTWTRPLLGGRVACVNSFGFGGTNSHAIVHEYVHPTATPKPIDVHECHFPPFITLSALDESSLVDQVNEVSIRLKEKDYDMRALSYTSTCRRDHRIFRKAFVANSQEDLMNACVTCIQTPTKQPPFSKPKVIFVFCGVGTTWQGMCNFMMKLSVFREAIHAIDKLLLPLSGWTLTSKLFSGSVIEKDPLLSHIAIFGCQVGLVEIWKSLGIYPDLVVGQSVGEVAAAYTSGSIDLQSAVRVIYYRSKFLSEVRNGTMAVVKNVETAKIEEFCSTTNGELCVAVYISPTSCTISGDKRFIDIMKEKMNNGLGASGAMLINLDVPCAYHSPNVETAAKQATQMLKILTPGKHVAPIISTVTGKEETHQTFAKASYWERNTRESVRFGDAVLQAAEKSRSARPVFLEIGPAPVLGAHVKALFKNQAAQLVLASMRKGNEATTLCNTICAMYEIGLTLKWECLVAPVNTRTDIPKYVFRQKKTPFKSKQVLTRANIQGKATTGHMYITDDAGSKSEFQIQINETNTPFIFDHVVKGLVLIPGGFHADIGFKIAQAVLGISTEDTIVSLEFTSPARTEKGSKHRLTVEIDKVKGTQVQFHVKQETNLVCLGTVKSQTGLDSHIPGVEVLHTGKANHTSHTMKQSHSPDLEQLRLSMMTDAQIKLDSAAIYEILAEVGFQYGNCFRILHECTAKYHKCLATFAIPEDVFKDIGNTIIHPCLLDGMLQSTFIAIDEKARAIVTEEKLTLLPVAIERLTVHEQPKTRTVYAYAMMTNSTILTTVLKLHFDIKLLNTDGTVIADVRNYTTYCRRGTAFTPDELRYQLSWSPIELEQCAPSTQKTLFINTFHHHTRSLPLTGETIAICEINISMLTEDKLQDSVLDVVKEKWGGIEEVEVMAVIFGKEEIHSDIDNATAKTIYEKAKQNCLVITWLLRFLMSRKHVPLFIITENTHCVQNTLIRPVNLTGCEIWGFVRNVLIEFVHDKVVLVDLQPSFEETSSKIHSLLASSLQNIESTRTEYIISADTVMVGTFSRAPVTETMSNFRARACKPSTNKYMVLSEQGDIIGEPFIVPLPANDTLPRVEKGSVEIEITAVSVHDNSIFPEIALPSSRMNDSLSDGNPMAAIEYTGYEIGSKVKSHFYRCQNDSVAAEESISSDRWQVAAVYPQQICTKMTVPRVCTVNLQKLPFYKHNMLSYAILFWQMTKAVNKGATVCILSEPPHDEYQWLLERMLENVVSASIVVYETSGSADTLVFVGRYDESQFYQMKNINNIVAVKYSVSNAVQKHLRNYRDTNIAEIDTQFTFSKKEVSRILQKVVPWLKRNLTPNDSAMSDRQVCIADAAQRRLKLRLPLEDLFGATDVFVITGGLTGLGWQTILMLLEKGVGVVATLSRREIDEETKKTIEDREKEFGCKILCFRGDVCNIQDVTSMIEALIANYGRDSIRGIIHGAGVLDSQLLRNVDEAQLDRVMAPKVLGVMNLHIATKHLSVDFFITQSSISSIIGMPGQGNYGAANIFLDVFARWRRSRGFAAQSINWGALEVGMAAQENVKAKLVKRGYNLLSIAQIRDCFVHIMMQNATGIVYANLDWSRIASDLSEPHMARVALAMKEIDKYKHLEHMKKHQTESEEFSIVAWKKLDDATRKQELERFIAAVTRRTIETDVETLTMESRFVELGLESLAAVTFSTVVEQETGYRISHENLFGMSLGDVASEIFTSVR